MSATVPTSVEHEAGSSESFPRRVLERWKKAAHSIGVVQTRFIMLMVYVAMVLPTGLLMRLFADPLHLKQPKSNFSPVKQEKPSLETAHNQF